MVDTTDEWIRERTGIRQRHIASDGEKTSDLALEAAQRALMHAGIDAGELDLIICATTTPDETFPATATMVQSRLGMTRGAAFDVQAVCSGFIYGLSVADSLIRTGQARTVLLIGAETMSRLLDWTDRTTCVLFGDGAGAVVLQAHEGKGDNADRGILNTKIFSDGRLHDLLYVGWRRLLDPHRRPSAHAGQGSLQARRHQYRRAIAASTEAAGLTVARHRLVRAPSGQPAHPGRHRPEARHLRRNG